MKINLKFDTTLTHIAGNPYGQQIYREQVSPLFKKDETNEIIFPDHIKGVSISFVQGLIMELVKKYGKDYVIKNIKLKSSNTSLEKRLDRNIKF